MAKTIVPCPQCHQPITIELTRLFDTNTDPEAKQKLLSGSANYFKCPICGAQGVYPTPIVYHDPDKELLLTFFPPDLHTPINEQERILGPMIKKAMDDLPPEKRKSYLFRPQTMLTQQRLFETILEADGITPEMIKAQQEKLHLLQQLLGASAEGLPEMIQQNDEKIDEEFFMLLSSLAQASAAAGDQESLAALNALQKALIEHSTLGKTAAMEAAETQEAVKELQELSKTGLTREKLLDLLIKSSNSDIRLTTIATMVRSGLDYTFFQLLSDKIEASSGEEKAHLESLRQRLLTITQAVDEAMKTQLEEARKLVNELLAAEDVEKATQEALPRINQAVVEVINQEAKAAQAAKDEAKLRKLSQIINVIQSADSSNAYLGLIDALLQEESAENRVKILEESGDLVNDEFVQLLAGLIGQLEQQGDQQEVLDQLKELNREILRFTMKRNLQSS
ncbi:MAG TPA: CpXC domain-containing protein [Anaerolineaceae bacterium]|nr:CpXC domain-containing protein [Anaerolineaceae bacterium]HQJ32830.1 CpXC domain-containing protein [Anaerolineaceae bacterium]